MRIRIREANGREKYIGDYNNTTNIFSKKVKASKHFFKKLDAWGIDAQYFTSVLKERKSIITIYDVESKTLYITSSTVMAQKGEYRHYPPHRAQIFLSKYNWVQSDEPMTNEQILGELV